MDYIKADFDTTVLDSLDTTQKRIVEVALEVIVNSLNTTEVSKREGLKIWDPKSVEAGAEETIGRIFVEASIDSFIDALVAGESEALIVADIILKDELADDKYNRIIDSEGLDVAKDEARADFINNIGKLVQDLRQIQDLEDETFLNARKFLKEVLATMFMYGYRAGKLIAGVGEI